MATLALIKLILSNLKRLFWVWFLLFWLCYIPSAFAVERIPLTLPLLQERILAPILSDGVATIDLRNLYIDLSENNSEFQEQFYQLLQNQITRSKKPLSLDFSESQIKGDFLGQRLGLSTVLSKAALPGLLTLSEQELLQQDESFAQNDNEQLTTVIIFRGALKFQKTKFIGKVDFSKTFFLKPVEANHTFFSSESIWSEARFGRVADFSNSIFAKEANFNQSHFLNIAKFRQVQFRGVSKWMNSRFDTSGHFTQSDFSQLADFSNSRWINEANFNQVIWRDRSIFSKSYFPLGISLKNSTFEKSVVFRSSYFNDRIDFQDVKLLDQVDFSNAEFNKQATINVSGLAFDSNNAKILGDAGIIGQVIYLPTLEGNNAVLKNLVRNFRSLELISDANQIEYKRELLRIKFLEEKALLKSFVQIFNFTWFKHFIYWIFLNILLLLSNYGTNSNLVFSVGIMIISYFGFLFWLLDRWRRKYPTPILPSRYDIICMVSSYIGLTLIGLSVIFQTSIHPWLSLGCLSFILFPIPLTLIFLVYQNGRYHDLMNTSYLVQDGTLRQLRILIGRLPIIPDYLPFRERYLPILWERRWNWLNYYDFSLNNLLKTGFNDIRLRDEQLPSLITSLVWYQWTLGILYISLLLWTLSRTIPGLNLLIYLK
ncbi:low-complexity protein [Aphanothece hegewaldii CCALA 016]|uniref:Low-complexity protein n=1 Tax=Aphanothece hegewaldii CCALA 016 TaxID=2107694 RepID=A0A2T1LZH4_9CHRO|nr:pentapeptide repeat-containing protein [Aphanothece hegewaldii]PSF37778.1 low-complexity protein [Aphanothece hegewaldii CCALA 016]